MNLNPASMSSARLRRIGAGRRFPDAPPGPRGRISSLLLPALLVLLVGTTAVSAQPSSPDLDRVRELIATDQTAAAESMLDDIIAAEPDDADALSLRADLLREDDRLDEAAQDYRRLVELEPDDTGAWFWLGTIARWQGRDADARTAYTRVVELSPCNTEGLIGRARVEMHAESMDAAERDLRKTLECRPDNETAADLLIDVLASSGRDDEARQVADDHFTGADMELRLARLAMDAGEPDRAAAHLHTALRIGGPDAEVYSRLGAAEYERGRQAAALDAYRKAHELDPSDRGTLYWIGVLAYRRGHHDESLNAWNALLEGDPESTGALIGKARILRARGHRAEAQDLVERALAVSPDNSEALVLRASLRLEQGRSESARSDYRNVLASSTDNVDAQIGSDRLGARHSWDSEARYSSSRVIEGLEDAGLISGGVVIRPTRIEYLTEGGATGFNSRLREGLDLAVSVSKYRQAVLNLDADAAVYDFDVWTAQIGLDHQLSSAWRLSWWAGATRYEARDTGSVPEDDRARGGLALVYDDGRDRVELGYERSPFIQRGFAGDFQFRIFDRDHFSIDWERILTSTWSLRASAAVSYFNDGDTPVYGRLEARWHRGPADLRFGVRHDPFPARFLGEDQYLVFIDYDAAYILAGADLGRGFSATAEARYGRFGATEPQAVVDGEIILLPPDHNTHRLYRADLGWTPPSWEHLRVGAEYLDDNYDFDTGPYNTLDIREWDLYAELRNERPERVRYALRYTRQLIDDERDPSYTGNMYTGLLEVRLRGNPYRDRSLWLGFEGRYADNDLQEVRERYRVYLRVPF